MIISASRRTDIPAFFSDWFFEVLARGQVEVPNPFNFKQISRVSLKKEDVTCFVFWTRNPEPFLKKLDKLTDYPYYFHITLNNYGRDLEPFFPPIEKRIRNLKFLASAIGFQRIIWRYDPIILTKKYTRGFHLDSFSRLCSELNGEVRECIISFLQLYKKTEKRMNKIDYIIPSDLEKIDLISELRKIADEYGIKLKGCAQNTDTVLSGLQPASCIDKTLIEFLTGKKLTGKKNPNPLRKGCLCYPSKDIGRYDSCLFGCLYCYAVKNHQQALQNYLFLDSKL